MRLHKYRVWNEIDKVMIYDLNSPSLKHGILVADPEDLLLEFTGLKDKNDKCIFEGDIINPVFEGDPPCLSVVVFEDGSYRKLYKDWDSTFSKPIIDKNDIEILNLEVVGNIYENPELLED